MLFDVKFASRLLAAYVTVILSCGDTAVPESAPREDPATYPDYPIVSVPPASADAGTGVDGSSR
jgi:hypothetical protein